MLFINKYGIIAVKYPYVYKSFTVLWKKRIIT